MDNQLATGLPTRERIQQFQKLVEGVQVPQPEPDHLFAPGMYMRKLIVPKGMCIVGKIHRHDHFLLVLSGKALVISEFGRDIVEAGHTSVSKAGVKRVVVAIEDTLFATIHHNPSDTQDLYEIEAAHIEPEPEQFAVKPLAASECSHMIDIKGGATS